jgi:hypothetical protein
VRRLALTFLAALVLVATAAGSVSSSALNRTTFEDALGEDPAAPDISTVRVSNDDEGRITFRIAVPSRPTLREDMRLNVYIDADNNRETGLGTDLGNIAGMDYRLLWDYVLHGDREVWALRCEGSVCSLLGGTKVALGYAEGPTITIDRSELGDTRRFRFLLSVADGYVFDPVTRMWDFTNVHGDSAPDAPITSWVYEVKLGPSRLVVQRFSTTPAKPVAGKTFVAKLKAKRDDNGALVTTGKVACVAAVGSARLRVQRSGFAQGAAFCTWHVPAGSSGENLRGSIGVTLSGKTAKKAFALKIS